MEMLGGQKIKSPGNVMNCPENQYICFYPSHPGGVPGGGGVGGSKFQKSGKCHELSRKSIQFVFTHPTLGGGSRGGVWGSKFQKSGKCHELLRKSITIFLPPPPKGVAVGINFRGSKNQKSGKYHELPRKVITTN